MKGTLGHAVLTGAKKIEIDGKTHNINIKVSKISFSAHTDSRGIVGLINHLRPINVVFVHGDE